jgi:hypothetical protein
MLGCGRLPALFLKGPNWWNLIENDASVQGQFGGLVNGSVCPRLLAEAAAD